MNLKNEFLVTEAHEWLSRVRWGVPGTGGDRKEHYAGTKVT